MKILRLLFLMPFLLLTGCGGSSDTIIIIDDTIIQTYTIEILGLSAVTSDVNYHVDISNIYSSATVFKTGDIATITDENDNAPITFTIFDSAETLIFTQTVVISDFPDPILLNDTDGNSIEFIYSIVVTLKK
ncbi:MAG: hypothetical protein COA79_01170 [Planctomycetota bacterium]|nr:MAG: hypothetical protein COA79_01170 [Planctomycetota bacterium]